MKIVLIEETGKNYCAYNAKKYIYKNKSYNLYIKIEHLNGRLSIADLIRWSVWSLIIITNCINIFLMYIIAQIANSKKIIQSTDKQSFIVLIVTCKLDFQNCIYTSQTTLVVVISISWLQTVKSMGLTYRILQAWINRTILKLNMLSS